MFILKFDDVKAISVNKLYVNIPNQRRKFTSTEGKKFKAAIETSTTDQILLNSIDLTPYTNKKLKVTLTIGDSWLLKDGVSVRKKDVSNLEKALLDSVFSSLAKVNNKLDDSYIWSITLIKDHTDTPYIELVIDEY